MLQLHYSTLSLKNIFSLFDSVDNGNLLYFSINRFFLHWPSELHANIFRSYVAYWHFNVQYSTYFVHVFLPWKCWLWLCCVRVEVSCWQFPAVFCVPRGGWRNHAAAADECPPFYTPAVCSFRLFLLVGAPCDISWWSNCEKYSPDNTSTIIELLFVNLTRPLKTCQKFCGVGNVRWFF